MQHVFDRCFKFKVNEDVWEAYLVTHEESIELDRVINEDEDAEGFPAMVEPNTRCLFVVEGHVTKGTLNHELLHMYVNYFHTEAANLDVDQFEECIAVFMEYSLDKFIKKRNFLYNRFKKLEGSGKKKR